MKKLLIGLLALGSMSVFAQNETELQGQVVLRWKIDTSRNFLCEYDWDEYSLTNNEILKSGSDSIHYQYKKGDSGKDIIIEKKVPVEGKGRHFFKVTVACANATPINVNDIRAEGNVVLNPITIFSYSGNLDYSLRIFTDSE